MTRDARVAPRPAPPTLRTRRLTLCPFQPEDAPAVARLVSVREIADTTLSIPHPYPEGAAERWIRTHRASWEAGTSLTYAITTAADGELIGAMGLAIKPEHQRAELGYWVAVVHWSRGYCTEAAGALLAHAFGPLALNRVEAHHFTRNPASGRVMQKLGMQLEGVHREAIRKWDRYEDLAAYAILARDWVDDDCADAADGRG